MTPIRIGTGRLRVAAAVVLAGILLAGCDSNSADKATVKNVTLERADLPAEWTQAPLADPVGAEGDDSRYGQCLGRPAPKEIRTATRRSDQFRLGDELQATSTARTLPDEAEAKADFEALRGDRGGPCLRQRLRQEIDRRSDAGNAPETVTVEPLPGLELGDETVAFRATLTYRAEADARLKVTYVDVVNVRKGTLELVLTLTSVGQPFPSELKEGLLTRLVGRI